MGWARETACVMLIHAYIDTYKCTYTPCEYERVLASECVRVCARVGSHVCRFACVGSHACACVQVRMHACVWVCVLVSCVSVGVQHGTTARQ